jgi:hypothetical protein
VGQVIVEPVMVFQTTGATVNNDLTNDIGTAANFLTAASTNIASRLTSASATPINVQAGVELQDATAGDALTLTALDLSPYSTAGQVINLNVRAAGSITINGTISDGVVTSAFGPQLTTTASGSLAFVAGADVTSANPLSVLAGSTAALTLGSGAVVRTGTGDLDLVAAGDVVFGSGSAAYVAGEAATTAVTIKGSGARQSMNFGTDGGNVTAATTPSPAGRFEPSRAVRPNTATISRPSIGTSVPWPAAT